MTTQIRDGVEVEIRPYTFIGDTADPNDAKRERLKQKQDLLIKMGQDYQNQIREANEREIEAKTGRPPGMLIPRYRELMRRKAAAVKMLQGVSDRRVRANLQKIIATIDREVAAARRADSTA